MSLVVNKPVERRLSSLVLADDDPDDHYFFKGALSEIAPDISITVVEDGETLLKLLRSYVPDIIFLDLDMPIKNGLECLVQIKAAHAMKDVPVVIFSSTSRPANIDTAYEMGADLFFIKPPTFSGLKESVQALLQLNWSEPSNVKAQFCVDGKYRAFM